MLARSALASACFAAFAAGLPTNVNVKRTDSYTFYTGDGSIAAGWPAQTSWNTWDDLWKANVPLMQQSCGWNGWGIDTSAEEIASINSAIQDVAKDTGVDRRFILAVMMQESKGCVRVASSSNGVWNPGLMQSHNGPGTCVDVNPCPHNQVAQMIRDGVAGTSYGDGLQQTLTRAQAFTGNNSGRAYYAAARLYNSGSANYNDLNDGLGSTACYASDVANRLTGWSLSASQCRA
jgi:hypothetical protein